MKSLKRSGEDWRGRAGKSTLRGRGVRYWIGMSCLTALLFAWPLRVVSGEFEPIFNGRDLSGWVLKDGQGRGYFVRNGLLICPADGGGRLYTEQTYTNFVLRFEFLLSEGTDSGVAIRAPSEGDPAYLGMEIQILDEAAKKYSNLRPEQRHGSIYGVVAAKGGALKKSGEWNQQEIRCEGRQVTVRVNGQEVLSWDLNQVVAPVVLQRHPGLLRPAGHLGIVGYNNYVEFRNIEVQRLELGRPDNEAPDGFQTLFNGEDFSGWKGLVGSPVERAKLSGEELQQAQAKADQTMRRNWKIEDGVLVYRGDGYDNLMSEQEFGDFELWVDWKLPKEGDSGIYLRGVPQVQIWDNPEGSGGLWNNKRNPSKPLGVADAPLGEWNRFRILMTGERVTVYLNGRLVTHNVILENYWERHRAVYPVGPIELQAHTDEVHFKNIFIRELPRK